MLEPTYHELLTERKQLEARAADAEGAEVAYDQLFGVGAFAESKTKPDPAQHRKTMLASIGEERAAAVRSTADANIKAEAAAQVKAAQDEAATLRGQLADAQAQIGGLKAEVAQLGIKAESVEQRAVQMVASVGHKPAKLDTTDQGPGAKTILQQFAGITDALERGRFYQEHEAEINAAMSPGASTN
jgi:hypothetical protein